MKERDRERELMRGDGQDWRKTVADPKSTEPENNPNSRYTILYKYSNSLGFQVE